MTSNAAKGNSPSGRIVTQLNAKQKYLLCEFVREYYALKALPDREFSELAATSLKFPVSVSSVMTAREVFDIPSTRTSSLGATKDAKLTSLESQVRELERKVSILQDRFNAHLNETTFK